MQRDPGAQPTRSKILLLAVLCEGGLLLAWLLLAAPLDLRPHEQGEVSLRALALGLAGTMPLLPLIWWLSHSKRVAVKNLMKTVDELVVPLLAPLTVTDFVLISLLAGVGEEGLFRGLLQGYLEGPLGEAAAVAVAAALFGLVHFITPLYALLAGVMGLYLGLIFAVTDNLLVPMVVHSLYDLAALFYLVKVRGRRRTPRG